MPSVVRLRDLCSGHGCFPSRANSTASPNVHTNGIPAHRLGDEWEEHCCVSCHSGVAATGSPNVHVNGIPRCRIGDQVDCGSSMMTGSPNVFANNL